MRNATIIANNDVECLIVMRSSFIKVIENFSKEAREKEKVLN